ncbi:DUF1176 domain-containing protein [Alterisphingorhabdus coralli]|uniref:DUF1176 domain-containing protein n=1 Tax=Alterisphingorhabdus coralli TaxID=3071408 RepID=A0AA97F9P0_9SPHN|nr:DUF1176 domain-containing protein [Parasphingorhabdus sp. SCSIO 66989]WOE75818.1 DUF1176 domain-containing protein [Parasphingorhabdus sp. SCSIO 66989]
MMRMAFLAVTAICALFAPLHMAAAQEEADAPKPGLHRGYGDWHLACDNVYSCEANSLASDFQLEQGATLRIQRQAGQVGYFRVMVLARDPEVKRVALLVDGRQRIEGEVDKDGRFVVPPGQSMTIARALARGKRASVIDTTLVTPQKVIAEISLKGSFAAMRAMDKQHGRSWTSDAIAERGRRSYRGTAERLPIVPQMAPADFEDLPSKKAMARLAEESGCTEQRNENTGFTEQAHPLQETDAEYIALVTVPCGYGAYNTSEKPFIARRAKDADDDDLWRFALAKFDYHPAWSENPERTLLVNSYYAAEDGILGSFAKGRGLGDCGSGESYVWDGQMFRLFEASAMDECRGVWEWPTIWRAYVQRR